MAAFMRGKPAVAKVTAITTAGVGVYAIHTHLQPSLHAESPEPPKTFDGGFGFKSLRLHSSESVNHNVKRLRFELPEENAVSGLGLTSSLLTFSRPQGSWLPALRPYTPVSDLDERGYIEFLIKRYPNGKASTHLHSLKPGDHVSFSGPLKGYQWTRNKHPHIVLITGGSGITPMYQLIQGILKDPEEKTKITLVYGVNTEEDILLRDRFQDYEKRFPTRFEAFYTVSRPSEGSPLPKGYIDKEFLQKVMPESLAKDDMIFLCGPPPMEKTMVGNKGFFGGKGGILDELGYTKDRVYKF